MNNNILHIKDAATDYFWSIDDILWCKSDGNYTDVLLTNMTLNKSVRIQIGQLEKLIQDLNTPHSLSRIDRFNIINLKYIIFLNSKKKTITLRSENKNVTLEKVAKSAFKPIRDYLAQLPTKDKDVQIVNRERVDAIKSGKSTHLNHIYVDMDLTSGTLWASEDMSIPDPELKIIKMTLYDSPMAEVENTYPEGTFEKLLELEEDAAKVNWGGSWRIPTIDEWKELLSNSTPQWAIKDGNVVCILTARNGNQIMLSSIHAHRGLCIYWTSTDGRSTSDPFSEEWFLTPKNCSVEIHESYANEPWYHFVSDFDSPECNLHAVISAKDLQDNSL
jgi:hypothetical protein